MHLDRSGPVGSDGVAVLLVWVGLRLTGVVVYHGVGFVLGSGEVGTACECIMGCGKGNVV